MIVLLHLAALIGTTLIVVRSTLFRPLQQVWPPFFACSQCFGMWVGMLGGGVGLVHAGHNRTLDAFIVGAATSFFSLFFDAVLLHLLGSPNDPHEEVTKP